MSWNDFFHDMDSAYVHIHSQLPFNVNYKIFDLRCEGCPPETVGSIHPNAQEAVYLRSDSSQTIELLDTKSNMLCSYNTWPVENGIYNISIFKTNAGLIECSSLHLQSIKATGIGLDEVVPPFLLYVIGLFLLLYNFPKFCKIKFVQVLFHVGLILLKNVMTSIRRLSCTILQTTKARDVFNPIIKEWIHYKTDDKIVVRVENSERVENETNNKILQNKNANSMRINSLDTVRGITVVLMIFINAGGAKYWYFEHSIWHGMTYADLPHPWFNWMLGFSIVLVRKSSSHKLIFEKINRIFQRCAKLFFIGFTVNSIAFGTHLSTIPYFGVCQDLALIYFVVATWDLIIARPKAHILHDMQQIHSSHPIHEWLPFRECFVFWKQLLPSFIFICFSIWLTFLFEVPGCGKGYLGPGGNHFDAKYKNCTGGAFGYIDRALIASDRLMHHLTYSYLYKAELHQDSYAIAEIPAQIVQAYLGMLAAEILILYEKKPGTVAKKWISICVLEGFVAYLFCNQYYCVLPLNRRMWTLSYVALTSALVNFILLFSYVIIDVFKIWTGIPFYYPGTNSIALFVGHLVSKNVFPFYWNVENNHQSLLFMHIWQVILWILISKYMYDNKIFLTV